jgi:hypothetical protein
MAYGTVKVDNITFDDGGSDQNVTVSGLYNSLTSGITVTGTISGAVVIGSTSVSGTTVAGVTVTGTTVQGASGTFTSLTGTTIQGTTATYTTGSFTSLTGTTIQGTTATYTTGSFTSLTGTTTTGTTANFASGVFTTSVSGTTVIASTGTFTSLTGTTTQGTTATYTTGSFTSLTGTTTTGTTSSFTSGVFTTLSGATATFTSGIIASGTAAAPSLAILADLDTGLFSPGANQLAVATNGTGRLFVDANGNVGVGTSSPANFAGFVTLALADSSGSEIDFIKGSTVQGSLYNANDKFYVESKSTVPIAFVTNGAERLRITAAGLVGVGTSSPSTKLEVFDGSITAGSSGDVLIGRNSSSFPSPGAGYFKLGTNNLDGSNGGLSIFTLASDSFQERVCVDSSGRVGIGTSAPSATLYVNNTSLIAPSLTYGATAGQTFKNELSELAFGTDTSAPYAHWLQARFSSSFSQNLALNPLGGNVGIGTSSPSKTLDVVGDAKIVTTASTQNILLGVSSGGIGYKTQIDFGHPTVGARIESERLGANTQSSLSFWTTSAAGVTGRALTIDASQRVGIGTTIPSNTLQVDADSEYNIFAIQRKTSPTASFSLGINSAQTQTNINYQTDGLAFTRLGSEAMRLDGSRRLLIGTSSARSVGAITARLQVEGSTTADASVNIINTINFTDPPTLRFGKVRGTGTVLDGDLLGQIAFCGHDGTDLNTPGAYIYAVVDGTPGANDLPSRLVFSTTADGASSPTERMRIGNKGNTTITSVADNDAALRVDSNGTSGTQYGIYIETGNDQNDATRTFLGCVGGATTRAQIRSNGGLANYQANDVNLSDIKVKKDISPAGDTWDCVKQWEIVNYRYNDQSDDADLNLGVIAQQVAESCPEVITVFQEAKEATEDAPAQEGRPLHIWVWMLTPARPSNL